MMFEDHDCITCFMQFKVPVGFTAARRKDGRRFYCPNGHSMSYPLGESEADKLRRERDRLAQKIAEKDDEIKTAWNTANAAAERAKVAERKTIAAKAQITKIKKRASEGICPCCNRQFVNLQAHMHTKHPKYIAQPTADERVH